MTEVQRYGEVNLKPRHRGTCPLGKGGLVTQRQGRLAGGRHICPLIRCVPAARASASVCHLSTCVSPHAYRRALCVHTRVCRFFPLYGCTRKEHLCVWVCVQRKIYYCWLGSHQHEGAVQNVRVAGGVCVRVRTGTNGCNAGGSLRPCRPLERPLEKLVSLFMSHLHITCTILNLPGASLPRDLSTSCSLCLVFPPLEMHKPHSLTFFTPMGLLSDASFDYLIHLCTPLPTLCSLYISHPCFIFLYRIYYRIE